MARSVCAQSEENSKIEFGSIMLVLHLITMNREISYWSD